MRSEKVIEAAKLDTFERRIKNKAVIYDFAQSIVLLIENKAWVDVRTKSIAIFHYYLKDLVISLYP